MDVIKVKSSVEKEEIEKFIYLVYETCKTDHNLSPRPLKEIRNAYKRGNLLIAFKGNKIIGWVLRINYNKNFQELAAGFIFKEYRSKGIFDLLLNKALPLSESSMIVTFNYSFAKHLKNEINFKESSFKESIVLSNGKFLINRLNIERIRAIRNHYKTGKPIYLIYRNDY